MLKTLGLYEDVSYRFSQWDPDDRDKYIGTPEQWDEAQGVMKKILDHLEIPYKIGIGEAAFYGPKLDIQIKNVYGKEDTLITIQIDQMLAEKFGMEYVDRDGVRNPYIIHRTSIGCYERTLALLIEKYAGAFPMWLAPVQVKLLTIADRHCDYAYDIKRRLEENGIRAEVDDRNEKIGYKIREARLQKVPYMLIIGDNEVENGTLSVRERGENGDLGSMSADEFIERAVSEEEAHNKITNRVEKIGTLPYGNAVHSKITDFRTALLTLAVPGEKLPCSFVFCRTCHRKNKKCGVNAAKIEFGVYRTD